VLLTISSISFGRGRIQKSTLRPESKGREIPFSSLEGERISVIIEKRQVKVNPVLEGGGKKESCSCWKKEGPTPSSPMERVALMRDPLTRKSVS